MGLGILVLPGALFRPPAKAGVVLQIINGARSINAAAMQECQNRAAYEKGNTKKLRERNQ